jgi:hypothetical protein
MSRMNTYTLYISQILDWIKGGPPWITRIAVFVRGALCATLYFFGEKTNAKSCCRAQQTHAPISNSTLASGIRTASLETDQNSYLT